VPHARSVSLFAQAEAELRARLRAQEERRSSVAMIDRLVHKQAAKTVARQGIVIEETVEMVWRSLELGFGLN
jgi:hypothetical protein